MMKSDEENNENVAPRSGTHKLDEKEAEMQQYVIKNEQRLRTLLKPVKDDAGELLNNNFTAMDYLDRSKWILIADLCIHLQLGVDVVVNFVEKINVMELLK